jgi:TatA/E family protein of Tat protein translocase
VAVPFDLSMGEVFLILFVALLVFGGKLPEQARRFGNAISEFKRGMREEMRKVEEGLRTDDPPEWRAGKPKDAPAGEPTRRDP